LKETRRKVRLLTFHGGSGRGECFDGWDARKQDTVRYYMY
jgi:hypothetical protein